MRSQYINCKIWFDEKFAVLTPMQQRLFLYLLASPHGNLIGLFVLRKGYIYEDLKGNPKDIERDFDCLLKAGFIDYDCDTGLVCIKNFLKYNTLTSPNQHKAVPRILGELPKSPLIIAFLIRNAGRLKGLLKDFERQFDGLSMLIEDNGNGNGKYKKRLECPIGHSSSPDGSDGPPDEDGKKEKPPCPYSKIVELYHSILPELSRVNVICKTTRSNIRNRWAEDPARWELQFWDWFFKRVGASDFLMGRNKDWRATFDWLFVAGNFGKVCNGAYDNHKGSRMPDRTRNNLDAAEAAKRMIEEGWL